jgi:DnaJ-class molecular chaperone
MTDITKLREDVIKRSALVRAAYREQLVIKYMDEVADLEVSDRESCSQCYGQGAVVVTPGRGLPYMGTCEYCGGCGKMG